MAWWETIMTVLGGGGGDIVGSILQYKLAKDLQEEALIDKAEGKEGMEALLADRQQAYNNVWKMIYGGVSNFDFSQMDPPGMRFGGPSGEKTEKRSGDREGATEEGIRTGYEKEPQGKGDLEKTRDRWTQHRLPREDEM